MKKGEHGDTKGEAPNHRVYEHVALDGGRLTGRAAKSGGWQKAVGGNVVLRDPRLPSGRGVWLSDRCRQAQNREGCGFG